MADPPLPFRRTVSANLAALAPSGAALAILYWSGAIAGLPALLALLGIAAVTAILVQRYLASLGRFARFVSELSGEQEPVMPRLSFAPATEELATAAATLAAGWRRQRAVPVEDGESGSRGRQDHEIGRNRAAERKRRVGHG